MPRLEQRLSQKQTLTPQQVLQATLLQLPTINLEQAILNELESNPILEQVEPSEEETSTSEDEPSDDSLDTFEDEDEYEPANVYDNSKEVREIPLPERRDFIEKLIEQLDLYDLTEVDRTIAEEILWNLDDRGYLAVELVLIGDRFGKTEEEMEPILSLVQHLEPKGLAARDLRECLLIQLDEDPESLAYRIIANDFDDFANKRYEAIEKAYGCSATDLAEVVEIICHLNPKPREGQSGNREDIVVPDLIAREQNGKWVIRTNDGNLPELGINPDYARMLVASSNLPTDARQYLKEKTDSANWFIRAIKQRRQTLTNVLQAIIKRQPDFFDGKLNRLRPMKLQDIADDIGMDISTISRSTRGKYVDLPFGVYELKSFFTEGIAGDDGRMVSTFRIKRALKDIVDSEDKQKPLNDEQLVIKLKERGFPVARRTVAKYREQLKLPVARLRRAINLAD